MAKMFYYFKVANRIDPEESTNLYEDLGKVGALSLASVTVTLTTAADTGSPLALATTVEQQTTPLVIIHYSPMLIHLWKYLGQKNSKQNSKWH